MIPRNAMVIVSDDLRVEATGKYTIVGVYTGNIGIPSEPFVTSQLVFTFLIETDVSDPLSSLTVQVTLPGNPPVRLEPPIIAADRLPEIPREAKRWFYRIPLFIQPAILRTGFAEAKVIHEKGEMVVGGVPIITRMPEIIPPSAPAGPPSGIPPATPP
jgi:hypothetical protein